MEPSLCFFLIPLISAFFLITYSSASPILGIHPLDEKYYASQAIKCKDGSKFFNKARINDNFCDCIDGTDEPGTSACPAGKFYCKNVGSTPKFLFSSQVNDHFCDCCDGSDEYSGSINCPNTCVMGGDVEYRTKSHVSAISEVDPIDVKEAKTKLNLEDQIHKLTGLKIVIILQVVLIGCVLGFCLFRRRARSRRRYR